MATEIAKALRWNLAKFCGGNTSTGTEFFSKNSVPVDIFPTIQTLPDHPAHIDYHGSIFYPLLYTISFSRSDVSLPYDIAEDSERPVLLPIGRLLLPYYDAFRKA